MTKPWIAFSLISMVFAGCTSVVAKIGLGGISGELGLAVRSCFVFAFVLMFSFAVVPRSELGNLTATNFLWLGVSGVTTALSWIFYYKALQDGQVSTIALIDKGSVVVAVILAGFVLKEQITFKTIVGALLMVSGLLVIARR